MSAQPADRYGSALDLAADIDRWLAGEAASAYAEPWTDTAFRWVRKHRLPVAVAAALLLAASVALTIGYVLVRNERDIAQVERQKAVTANERAQANAKATRDVVDEFLIQVGDDRWSQIPHFEEVRLEMVQLAVDRYRALLADQPDDVSLAADAAQAFHRCANLYRMVGRLESAKGLYDEAISRFRAADSAKPQVAAHERRLCETLIDRAVLIRRVNGPKAAEEPMRESLSAARALQKRNSSSWDAVGIAGRAQFHLAELLYELGRESQGIDLARVAIGNLRQAARRLKPPSATLLTLDPPLSLAEMLRETGHLADAKTVLDDVIERASRELAATPEDTNLRFIVARGRFQRALIDAKGGAPSEASRGALTDAVQALEQLVTEFPKTASFRRNLAEALTAKAVVELHDGHQDTAAVSAAGAIAHLEQLDGEQHSPAVFQALLGSAYTVAAEAEFARGDRPASRAKLQAAQDRLNRARELNPESQRLSDEAARAKSLLNSLER
jgi:tetratricopeptide (TPR) repeat protein